MSPSWRSPRDERIDHSLASGYFGKRFRDEGWPWVEVLLVGELMAKQCARVLLATNDHPASWEHAEAAGEAVVEAFWRDFPVYGLGREFPYVDQVTKNLFKVGRVAGGLNLLNLYLREDAGGNRAKLVASGLEQMLHRENDPEVAQLAQYGLRSLLDFLERSDCDRARLARIEWAYLPVFGFEAAPPTLSRHLAASPDFFADVVSRVYRPCDGDDDGGDEEENDGGEEPELSENDLAVARNAYRLLSEWRILPGLREDGAIDAAALRVWVERARARLRESKRLWAGDINIGHVLAASPPDADGAWPCLAVRNLLEDVQSPQIESGMQAKIFNSLGVTNRGGLDGGDQERNRGAIHREQAKRFVDRWPRTAAVLNKAADSFDRAGRRHDEGAERRRTGFDN